MLAHQNVHHNKQSFVKGLSPTGEAWLRKTDTANLISMLPRGHVTLPGRPLLLLWWSSWSGPVGLVQLVQSNNNNQAVRIVYVNNISGFQGSALSLAAANAKYYLLYLYFKS